MPYKDKEKVKEAMKRYRERKKGITELDNGITLRDNVWDNGITLRMVDDTLKNESDTLTDTLTPKIEPVMKVVKGMVEAELKEVKDKIKRLEERVSKIEELLQDVQGEYVNRSSYGYGSKRSSKDDGNGDLPFSKSRHVAGKLPKGWV